MLTFFYRENKLIAITYGNESGCFKQGKNVKDYKNPRIIIVGAGFSGIGFAIRLQQAGFTNIKIFERGNGIGGVWWFNTYPGIAVDLPAVLYSYSFEPKPDWSKRFAPGSEIQQYIEYCAEKYNVRKCIQFNKDVVNPRFNEQTNEWIVNTTDGEEYVADFLISARGSLTEPKFPPIKGVHEFKNKIIHSAKWDNTYDFTNKTVAVIGTGASAIQIIPELAKIAKHLTIFQRSSPWVIPRLDAKFTWVHKALFKYLPFTQKIARFYIWARSEFIITTIMLRKGIIAKILRKIIIKGIVKYREEQIKDPELLKKVTPDYELGCKRVLLSDDYYPALKQKNVELITDPIDQITSDAVVTQSNEGLKTYVIDALVFATGFNVAERPWNITGLNGLSLKKYWEEVGGPEAYKGVAVSGFPNFFMSLGPNTAAGSMSTLYSIEVAIEYVVKAIKYLSVNQIDFCNVKKEIMDSFNYHLQKEIMPHTVWLSGCRSWYKTENGKVITIWPDYARHYAETLAKFVPSEYELKNLNKDF